MEQLVIKQYDYLFNEIADNRVKDWFLISSPLPIFAIILCYIAIVKVFLPKFMENRKPYSLKTVIYYYNIFQIIACLILIYGVSTSGWTTYYTLGCQEIDYSNNPMALRMLNFVYWTFILKFIELIETCFFVLRKKYNQVTKLHVYHHSSTLMLAWIGVKYIGGGMATFPIIINSFIHILMYTYYLLSSLGPEWQKHLAQWKPRLTMLQMIQFCILVLHSAQAIKTDCNVPKAVLYLYIPNVFTIFYMFYDFYNKSYRLKIKKQ